MVPWIRSFFNLRWRLAFVYIALFVLFGTVLSVFLSESTSSQLSKSLLLLSIGAALVMIILGALIIFFLTGIMLRPLRQIIDATQAIAHGDLQRRVPVPQSDDEIGSLAVSFNQMADRIAQLFEEQQASQRRTRRFVSDASHELRTPITSLRGFTEVLMRGAKDDPATTQRVLKLMKDEAERMTRLVNDLLMLARLDEEQPLELSDVDLVDIAIEGARQMQVRAVQGCKVALDLATQERLRMRGDVERLQQMLLVLLDNAGKYGCNAGTPLITLRLDRQNGHALLQVIDNGHGISPEDLPHVFDRFYRGQPALRPSGTPITGTGLGLSIAAAIARAHQGDITVCSEPDKETVFTVTLPCNP